MTIAAKYGSASTWTERAYEATSGLATLTGQPLPSREDFEKSSFFSLLSKVVDAGLSHKPYPLPIEEKAKALFENVLGQLDAAKSSTDLVVLLADIANMSEKLPFAKKQARQEGYLLMNYVASLHEMPLIVFSAEEKSAYEQAVGKVLDMRLLLAKKVQQAALFKGHMVFKIRESGPTGYYKAPDSKAKIDLAIEWHALIIAIQKWKKELS